VRRHVEISRPAQRDLRRLDPGVASRVLEAIGRYADTGYGDVTRLHGIDEEYRLRVGDWRVRFRLRQPDLVEIIRVLPRGRAYRD
jgi:mRNA interferase RelE/StbE